MTATAEDAASHRGAARSIRIREHRIPSANSAPYICVEGPDRNLWFCESGAAKIGCFDPRNATFKEFPLPAEGATPIGIALGGDGNLWFAQKKANKIGRLTPAGALAEFPVPTANAGPDGIALGTGRQCLVFRNRSEPDRPHHAGRRHHRIQDRHNAGQQAAVDRGARWRAVVQRSRRQPGRPHHRRRRGE